MDSVTTSDSIEFDRAKSRVRPSSRRRDRHDRGLRGTLAPGSIPVSRSRAEDFASIVDSAMQRIESNYPELLDVDIDVEDVPPGPRRDGSADPIPLGRVDLPSRSTNGSLVVYRFPIEHRTSAGVARERLVRAVCTELAAELLGISPVEVDPQYDTGV
ncbi:MAG: metallopeptidase family protein [Candidatus Nanopelagicales bacterium]